MHCVSCGTENPAGAKFCIECATPFQGRCPKCGSENPLQAKFCAECATPLTGKAKGKEQKAKKKTTPDSRPQTSDARLIDPRLATGERRQLTVMFCDLVGSTALSTQLDPEELHEVVHTYQETCAGVIQRYEGHIAQHLGDGLLVYFGYPVAHEDDGQRAVRAGLEIIEKIRGRGSGAGGQEERQSLSARLSQPLQVRIGIHTGLVVVGEVGSSEKREILALGETPNLAARLQALAEPNTVLISATTSRLVQGLFECWELGPQQVKGISTPLVEAIGQLTKGLELLKILPDTPERAQHELRLQITLAASLIVIKGYGASEVGHTFARARELCQQVGETRQLFPVLGGLCAFYQERAEFQVAQELAEQLLRLAQSVRDPVLLLWAHFALGLTFSSSGAFPLAREHLEQSLALYSPRQRRSAGIVYDPGVGCLSRLAHVLFSLGYPDQALKRSQEALALAREISHPFSLVASLLNAAGIQRERGEEQAAQELAESVIPLSDEQGFARFSAYGTILQGWELVEQGQGEAGIIQMRQGLAAVRATGAEGERSWVVALLAKAYGKVGQAEEGLRVLIEALTTVHELSWESELYRLKGELTLQKLSVASGQLSEKSRVGIAHHDGTVAKPETVDGAHPTGEEEAEACFLRAIDVARQQQARSLELRATVSLARLWQHQGKKKEAHAMLAALYSWFTEGFDTVDLKETRVLLAELA